MSGTEIRFYHLQSQTLTQALPALVSKAYSGGHRIHIRVANDKLAKTLSDAIWSKDPSSFIPHGTEKDGNPEHQPVWISTSEDNENAAQTLIITNGAEIDSSATTSFTLICDMFDGKDDEAVNSARARWKNYKDLDLNLTYWQQDDRGAWSEKG